MRSIIIGLAIMTFALPLLVGQAAAREERAYIGVKIRDLTDAERKLPGVEKGGTALAGIIAGGPAEKAGLKADDIIVTFAAKPTKSSADLSKVIAANKPGAEVPVVVIRAGERKELKITIGGQKIPEPAGQLGGGQMGGWKMPAGGRSVIVIRRGPSSGASAALLVPPVEQDALELLLKAEALEKSDNWIEAVEIYQSMMEQMGDKVLALEEGTYVGIRSWCEDLIMSDPQRLKAYRENFDRDAERPFRQAKATADDVVIRELAERYGLTSFGEEILAVAGMMAMEQGRTSEAAYYMKRLCRMYPNGKWTKSRALPVLYLCGRESGNAGSLRELREFVTDAGFGGAKVVIDQKPSTIDNLLAGVVSESSPSAAGNYASFDGYFEPHQSALNLGKQRWSKNVPPPPPEQPQQVTTPFGWQIDLPTLDGKKSLMHPLTLAAGDGVYLKREAVTAYGLADGTARDNVETDLFQSVVKTPGAKPWEVSPEQYKVKSNTIRHNGALYLCYEYFDKEHSFSQFSLCRIDETTGTVAWTTDLCSSPRSSEAPLRHALTRSGNTIYTATNAGMIAAVEMSSGSILWIFTYEPKLPSGEDEVIVIDSARPETMQGNAKKGDYTLKTYPVINHNGNVIFFPADQDAVFAVNEKTGKLTWKFAVDRKAEPLLEGIVGNTVILSQRGVVALDATSGKELWKWNHDKSLRCGKGALTPDALYTPMADGVYRIDLRNGTAALAHPWKEEEAGTLMMLDNATIVVSNTTISCYGKK